MGAPCWNEPPLAWWSKGKPPDAAMAPRLPSLMMGAPPIMGTPLPLMLVAPPIMAALFLFMLDIPLMLEAPPMLDGPLVVPPRDGGGPLLL